VVRVADFGAFVEILPGTDGMVHISQLASERVEKVEDVARLGDELTVMVTAIDDSGKILLFGARSRTIITGEFDEVGHQPGHGLGPLARLAPHNLADSDMVHASS